VLGLERAITRIKDGSLADKGNGNYAYIDNIAEQESSCK